MKLLAGTAYDPGTAASAATSSLQVMTALDTTNLRLVFTVPSNGTVFVNMRGAVTGGTDYPGILLGVMQGASVLGRVCPFTARMNAQGGTQVSTPTAAFLVTGLTPGASLTWDAAMGVEFAVASTTLKYGGPNNTTTNDAWGAFNYEIWDTVGLLGGMCYDPASAISNKSTANPLAMTALDTTNLRVTFTCPSSGSVLIRQRILGSGATSVPAVYLGVLDGATVRLRNRASVAINANTIAATSHMVQSASGVITGLTPGTSYSFDMAYGVEIGQASSNLKYGGPDDTSQDTAYGGCLFEVWDATSVPRQPAQIV